MMKAKFIGKEEGFVGTAYRWRLDEPIEFVDIVGGEPRQLKTDEVITSAVVAYSGPECLVFPVRKRDGSVCFIDLGGYNAIGKEAHEKALKAVGVSQVVWG